MLSTLLEPADFAPYFRSREAGLSLDEALMRRVFELRFQVYCLECGFLPADNYPDHLETDDHDVASAHFCAFDLKEELVGCVRLIHPDAVQTFPFQSYCPALFEDVTLAPPSKAAEISRLMVHHEYRRRKGDNLAGVTVINGPMNSTHEMRSKSPQILLSLYRQMYRFSLKNDIRYWYAAMESSLARALTRMNFGFRQIGPSTDYYGPVAPYLADLRELETLLTEQAPALMAWMQKPETTEY